MILKQLLEKIYDITEIALIVPESDFIIRADENDINSLMMFHDYKVKEILPTVNIKNQSEITIYAQKECLQ